MIMCQGASDASWVSTDNNRCLSLPPAISFHVLATAGPKVHHLLVLFSISLSAFFNRKSAVAPHSGDANVRSGRGCNDPPRRRRRLRSRRSLGSRLPRWRLPLYSMHPLLPWVSQETTRSICEQLSATELGKKLVDAMPWHLCVMLHRGCWFR